MELTQRRVRFGAIARIVSRFRLGLRLYLPPPEFVPVSPPRWRVLCELLQQPPGSRELRHGADVVGWHVGRLCYVDPDGYKAVSGGWPPGYWPGLR